MKKALPLLLFALSLSACLMPSGSPAPSEPAGDGTLRVGDPCDVGTFYAQCSADVNTPNTLITCEEGVLVFWACGPDNVCNAQAADCGYCGNGELDPGEQCDDVNTVNGDGCDNNCTASRCGNGAVGGEEECDDANEINDDACTNACHAATCGDGIVFGEAEECDDSNNINEDDCAACTLNVCGDGIPNYKDRIVTALQFEWLATSCNGAADILFLINGAVLLDTTGDTGSCRCNPGVHSVVVTDPAVLGMLTNSTTLSVLFLGNDQFLSWAKLTVIGSPTSAEFVLFDVGDNGDAQNLNPDLCQSGYLNNINTTRAANTLLIEQCDDGNEVNNDSCTNACTQQ